MYEVSRFRLPFEAAKGGRLPSILLEACVVGGVLDWEAGAGELILLQVHLPTGQPAPQLSSPLLSNSRSWWTLGNLRIRRGGETGSALGPEAGPLLASSSSSSSSATLLSSSCS